MQQTASEPSSKSGLSRIGNGVISMRRLGIFLAATFLSASTVSAADILYREPPPAPVAMAPVIYDWTGFYLGGHGGYVWTRLGLSGDFATDSFDGGLLGAHTGANWQVDNWVFGVEGDISYTWNENTYIGEIDIGTDWQGSVRARLGYAIDRTLIFATGGLAITRGYVEIDLANYRATDTFTGWTVGGGLEHAFTNNWTTRLEYRYSDYGREDFGFDVGNFSLKEHSVRAGVSFKF